MIRGAPPVLVTPPASPLVPLAELRDQCRVDHAHEDQLLLAYERAAVAYLDGYGGILGRAILLQTWRQDFAEWGRLRLALPDVRSVTVVWFDAAGDEHAADSAALGADAAGSWVDAAGPPAERVRVEFVAGMPDDQVDTVRQAVRLMVAHAYDERSDGGQSAAAMSLIAGKRRARV